ncbi:UDP-N-acetylmuramoyl-L-alanyl-D-glutamate--2,6-diaminopimelate ligase [Patulibacter sp.]|uniref:UDP-N-acetylmuramoyl-L-alanyl-D-glutamate--2, 6-diaminopimelate ligase n=1 Tax=Patulibacter sp. TaxID=1912859 RepID=UPI0027181DD3|nr:UDP-N-acetylmuramoyl-L-alanyl-D-glutamate--2,6-diaminopimelate ligase [Patulibacter sp.]MDO9410358.1 UDP-N-acetylmuramoyl-L-alanyl-D-glutamate--2,6-diaminopimelate ligase [Patulibacter sp.]
MTLGDLFQETPESARAVAVSSLAYDDRRVGPGTVFFCVRGLTRDGHEFASTAVERGAAALVVDHPLDSGVPEVVVPDVRAAMAPAAARLAGDPTTTLSTVGITGTNGKTTTAFLVRALLEAGGRPTGLLGTVAQIVGGEDRDAGRTTPEAIDLQPLFAEMTAAGDRACVMEVSSHALSLGRADAIHWAAAIFTNLTQDHLDFHPTMEDYFLAKARLFEQAEGAPKVVDVDDPYGRRLAQLHPDALTVSLEATDARFRATDVRTGLRGSSFVLDGRELSTPMPGRFNVMNALQAFVVAVALGVDEDVAAAALADAGRVPGRLESVDAGQSFAVLVDYAHTPDSLHNVLAAATGVLDDDLAARRAAGDEGGRGRSICVFGCGGDRDRGKRPLMGGIAAAEADVAIATSDNPRSEDPAAILDEVLAGADGAGTVVERIEDRRAAIARALDLAGPRDVVLITGKGHEQGQQFADRTVPFDDRVVARELLGARAAAGEEEAARA